MPDILDEMYGYGASNADAVAGLPWPEQLDIAIKAIPPDEIEHAIEVFESLSVSDATTRYVREVANVVAGMLTDAFMSMPDNDKPSVDETSDIDTGLQLDARL